MNHFDLLTSEAQFLLTSMYKSYLDKRKEDALRADASFFGSIADLQSEIMSEWKHDDVESVFLN